MAHSSSIRDQFSLLLLGGKWWSVALNLSTADLWAFASVWTWSQLLSCMEMGSCADFDASCEPNSVLGLFIKVYCSGKDYKSEEHSVLASSWFCSSPLPMCFSLNKGKYYHFSFFFFWKGNGLSYLSNRNWQAVRKMSTMPSFFSCLQQTLVAIKQPVLPMPALRKGKAERGSGDVRRTLELSCQATATKPAQTPSSLLSLRPLRAGCFQMESHN